MKYGRVFMVTAALSCAGCWFIGSYKAATTPMPAASIALLTTCQTVDLSRIKKNLILSGYSVDRADADTLQTGYKQLEGGSIKMFEKIAVVRVDNAARFTVRVRQHMRQEVETDQLRDRDGRTIATGSRMENTTDESDMSYYEEERIAHEARRKRVCGDGA